MMNITIESLPKEIRKDIRQAIKTLNLDNEKSQYLICVANVCYSQGNISGTKKSRIKHEQIMRKLI